MVTVGFFRGRQYAKSWLLAWWQRSDFSHCVVVLRQVGDVFEVAESTLFGGVHVSRHTLPEQDWEVYLVPGDHDGAVFWLTAHLGQAYGLLGLLGFLFRRIKGPADQWWCSKAVAAMLGFQDAWRYDVATLRDVCRRIGTKVAV